MSALVSTSRPSSSSPASRAMARAVAGWSPVSMMTWMPASWQRRTAAGTAGRSGSPNADEAQRSQSLRVGRQATSALPCGHHQDTQAAPGQFLRLGQQRVAARLVQRHVFPVAADMGAARRDGFGRALDGQTCRPSEWRGRRGPGRRALPPSARPRSRRPAPRPARPARRRHRWGASGSPARPARGWPEPPRAGRGAGRPAVRPAVRPRRPARRPGPGPACPRSASRSCRCRPRPRGPALPRRTGGAPGHCGPPGGGRRRPRPCRPAAAGLRARRPGRWSRRPQAAAAGPAPRSRPDADDQAAAHARQRQELAASAGPGGRPAGFARCRPGPSAAAVAPSRVSCADGDDDGPARAGRDVAAFQNDPADVRPAFGRFGDGQRLAGQGRLVHFQRAAASSSRASAATRSPEASSRMSPGTTSPAGIVCSRAVAQHGRRRPAQLRQRLRGLARLPLLPGADGDVDHDGRARSARSPAASRGTGTGPRPPPGCRSAASAAGPRSASRRTLRRGGLGTDLPPRQGLRGRQPLRRGLQRRQGVFRAAPPPALGLRVDQPRRDRLRALPAAQPRPAVGQGGQGRDSRRRGRRSRCPPRRAGPRRRRRRWTRADRPTESRTAASRRAPGLDDGGDGRRGPAPAGRRGPGSGRCGPTYRPMARSQAAKASAASALSETKATRAPSACRCRIALHVARPGRAGSCPARRATACAAGESASARRMTMSTLCRRQVCTSSATPDASRGRRARTPSGAVVPVAAAGRAGSRRARVRRARTESGVDVGRPAPAS